MKLAIITVAGISSRFNKDIPEDEKILKCIYYENDPKNTLLYQMATKLEEYEKIVVVGGYKYSDLEDYISAVLPEGLSQKILLVYNDHYDDLSSGYSLYLGIKEALENFSDIDEILFVEGDLDIDKEETAKILMIFWCLFTFITAGFEHSVANMSFLAMGYLIDPSTITLGGYAYNIILVSLGNFIGGVLFLALPYYFITSGSKEELNNEKCEMKN